MTPRQLFKEAFIANCIDRGLTTVPEITAAARRALAKSAGFADAAGSLLGTSLGVGAGLAIAAPPVLGYAAGRLAGGATDIDEYDVEDAKRQEVIDAYHQEAARARRRGLVQRFAAQRASAPGRRFA